MKITPWKRMTAVLVLAAMLGQGCAAPGARLQYLIGEEKTLEHYKDYATAIEFPVESEPSQTDPALFRPPRSLNSLDEVEQRFVSLDECVRLALANSSIIIDDQSFGSPGNPLLANPSRVASVYDTAIQETSFLFGNRGTEAALSDFDAILTNSMQVGRAEDVQNTANVGLNAGDVLVDDTAQWQARLEKAFANSGTFALQHEWNYSEANTTRLFPSAYTGSVSAEYRQPLLAGAGTEFTRTAGPLAQGVRGVSGVSQGVLISRINTDISLVDFEQSVTTLVRDVEKIYWDLYLSLQLYHSEVETFRDIVEFQKTVQSRRDTDASDAYYQAINRLYEADARMKGSLVDVQVAEQRLRRLLGLPLEDGQFLTPVDKPTEAKLVPDWESCLIESLTHRPELRRQKWEIRSLELQLAAAKNLARPRLDFVSNYKVNGFGDHLLGSNDDDGQTDVGYNSAYEALTQGNNTGWGVGVQFSMPVGLRLARAQVRNYELRLRKARQALQRQETEVSGELLLAMREMERWYELAESGAKRAENGSIFANTTRARVFREKVRDPIALGRVLEAKITSRDADQSYLRSVIEYNKAITDLNFRKGTLLANNSVFLSEGEWNPEAYDDVLRRAEAMTHAIDNPQLESSPSEFVAGPGQNAWESLGSPDRPHIPGVIDEVAVPQSNIEEPREPSEPAAVPPAMDPEEATPPVQPRPATPPQEFDATFQDSALPESGSPRGLN
ncbi:MAG: TolC family protein [Planctomycetota bacterium]